MHYRLLWIFLVVAMIASPAIAQKNTYENAVLFAADSASEWSCDESTMDAFVSDEASVLRWRINVDYDAGEAKYPIGWPRAVAETPETHQNWQNWDFVQFSIKTQASRAPLPPEPAGLILFDAEGKRTHTYPLTDAKLNEWVPFKIPTADLPSSDSVGRIQFYISESNYAHGDSLTFFIDHFSLVRHTSPALVDVVPASAVVFDDIEQFSLRIRLSGLSTGERADVVCAITKSSTGTAVARVSLQKGWNDVAIPLPGGLVPGEYVVRAGISGNSDIWKSTLRAIESPWR